LACAFPQTGDEKPRSLAYVNDDGQFGWGWTDWLQRLKNRSADSLFDVATLHLYADLPRHTGYNRSPEDPANAVRSFRAEYERNGLKPVNFWLTECGAQYPPWPDTARAALLQREYAAIQAANAEPVHPVEQGAWFIFSNQYMNHQTERGWASWIRRPDGTCWHRHMPTGS
jgi:hypothetical protein